MFEVKYQGEGNLDEAWHHDDGSADAQPSVCVIECALECCKLLALGRFRQSLPHRKEKCVLQHLSHKEEVGNVSSKKIGEYFDLPKISHTSLLLPVLSHIQRHLPYVCGYQQPLHAMQHSNKPGEVAC